MVSVCVGGWGGGRKRKLEKGKERFCENKNVLVKTTFIIMTGRYYVALEHTHST